MKRLACAFLLASFPLFAAPVVSSITPSRSPVGGGSLAVIVGTGFLPGATVVIGGLQTSAAVLSDTAIQVVLPPHLPALTSVTVTQADGAYTLENALRYEGTVIEAFDAYLLPVYTPPIRGAFGSEFRTQLLLWNESGANVAIYGLGQQGDLTSQPLTLRRDAGLTAELLPNGKPGRVIYIPRHGATDRLTMNLRAWDVSRDASNYGTAIPVVPFSDFRLESFALNGVPLDPRFRITLRVYGLLSFDSGVVVTFGNETRTLKVPATNDIFTPAYAELSDFPRAAGPTGETMRVIITPPSCLICSPTIGVPMWGFITVTNNETQHITTIAPQAAYARYD